MTAPNLRKGDRVRVVDAKRREDLAYDGREGRVIRDKIYGELFIWIDAGLPPLPLEGPNALIVELLEESAR